MLSHYCQINWNQRLIRLTQQVPGARGNSWLGFCSVLGIGGSTEECEEGVCALGLEMCWSLFYLSRRYWFG